MLIKFQYYSLLTQKYNPTIPIKNKTILNKFILCWLISAIAYPVKVLNAKNPTPKKQSIAVKIAEYLEINEFFDYIIGETEIIKSKLDPNLAQILSEKYPRSKILVIGDHPKDAMLAKSIGCPFIGVLTGFHTAYQLKKARDNENQTLIIKNVKRITLDMIYSVLWNRSWMNYLIIKKIKKE